MKLLTMFWLPKPAPMASAPPRKLNAVIGTCKTFSDSIVNIASSTIVRQRLQRRDGAFVQV